MTDDLREGRCHVQLHHSDSDEPDSSLWERLESELRIGWAEPPSGEFRPRDRERGRIGVEGLFHIL